MKRQERIRLFRLLKWTLFGTAGLLAMALAFLTGRSASPLAVAGVCGGLVGYLVYFTVQWPRRGEDDNFWYLTSSVELVLVTALVYLTGGVESPFYYLMLLVAVSAGLKASPWAGVGAGVLGLFLYSIAWLLGLGTLEPALLAARLAAFPCLGSLGFVARLSAWEREDAKREAQARRLEHALQTAREQAREKEGALEKLYDKTRKLTSLMQVSRHLSTVRRADALLQQIVDIARQEMNSGIAAVFLVRGKELVPAHSHGLSEISIRALQCSVGEGVLGELVLTGEALRLSERDGDPALQRITGTREKIRTLLAVPLKTPQDQLPFGILAAANILVGDRFEAEHEDYLRILATDAAISIKNISLYNELERAYYETIQALAQAIEAKDPYTHGHVGRVRTYAVRLARALGLPEEEVELIAKAAILHDVGKISTPDRILNKEGPLTDEEFEIMKAHAENSLFILKDIRSLPPRVIDMVVHHHERYDGRGYPHGLEGEEIPLGGQILAIADCYDAMTSDRPYRKGFTPEEALQRMEKGLGTQFNPRLLRAFFGLFGYKSRADLDAPTRGVG